MPLKTGRCLLRDILRKRKMSQQELADLLGVSKQTISKYVRNEVKMSYNTALNIAFILKCDMSELYEIIEVGACR